MALIKPIPSGNTPDTLTITLWFGHGTGSFNNNLNLTQAEVDALNAMGYYYVTTNVTPKTAIATGMITIASVSDLNVNATITFSKT